MTRTLIETYSGWNVYLVHAGCHFEIVNRHAPVWASEGQFLSVRDARATVDARIDCLASEASDAHEAFQNERNNCGDVF